MAGPIGSGKKKRRVFERNSGCKMWTRRGALSGKRGVKKAPFVILVSWGSGAGLDFELLCGGPLLDQGLFPLLLLSPFGLCCCEW